VWFEVHNETLDLQLTLRRLHAAEPRPSLLRKHGFQTEGQRTHDLVYPGTAAAPVDPNEGDAQGDEQAMQPAPRADTEPPPARTPPRDPTPVRPGSHRDPTDADPPAPTVRSSPTIARQLDRFMCQVIRSSSGLAAMIDRDGSVNFTVDTARADAWAHV
jgi:hypothetical protein